MLFSFLTRATSSKPKNQNSISFTTPPTLNNIVNKEGGKLFAHFNLFHNDTINTVDLLIFLPHFGIFIGETISWRAHELKDATVERSSRRIKRPAATRFESTESKIRRKLEDVLSFDSTPLHRFLWMQNITEKEFDLLDPSFHALMPKKHLIFSNDDMESIKAKFYALGEYRDEPLSAVKILGALNSHTFVLPTLLNPEGALLSPQQNLFLLSEYKGVTTLCGAAGSGKSMLLIRKALFHLLSHPHEKVIIITPTLLGGELLRKDLVSLLEYGALSIDLSALSFYTPMDRIENLKSFQEASMILCDDAYLFEPQFIQKLETQRGKRWLLLTAVTPLASDLTFNLSSRFRKDLVSKSIPHKSNRSLVTALLQLRKILADAKPTDILIVVSDDYESIRLKEAVDEYFDLDTRLLLPGFSLQYQDLDSVIITTTECIAPLSRAHVLLIEIDSSDPNYPLALSRASESLTIISSENSIREDHTDENHEN